MKHLLAMLVAVTGLVSYSTGRCDVDMSKMDPPEKTVSGQYEISANWSELNRGWNDLSLLVTDANGTPVEGATFTVIYDMDGMPMDPPDKPVVEQGKGVYLKNIFIGMYGGWKFEISVEKDRIQDVFHKFKKITKH